MTGLLMRQVLLVLMLTMSLPAQRYSARQLETDGLAVVELADRDRQTVVSVVPSLGNNAYQMLVNGKNVFYFPFKSLAEFSEKRSLCGNPFLAPWANRLDEDGFYANGKFRPIDPQLTNVRRDANKQPIHGLLLFATQWEVAEVKAEGSQARVVSRLDFSKYPELMAHFPFAHVIEMSYILSGGALEVKTRITNQASEAMPVSVGFHPYFQVHDAPRERWKVRLDAGSRWLLSEKLIPTGEKQPIGELFPDPRSIELRDLFLDHVFGDLVRDQAGLAHFSVTGEHQQITVSYGPQYKAAVIFAPRPKNGSFICFEPMSGITNAFNLAQRGIYKELQAIPPKGVWEASYTIRPSGF
jgi:aldose 1-epimerase